MTASPVIEWRTVGSGNTVVSSLALAGTGFSGAIPVGTTSTPAAIRIYNNFAAASSIADALNCTLAVYDDAVHQGLGTAIPTTALYVQVEVVNYNGTTTGADTSYYGIGGQTKHAIPTNSGTISGSGANYVTVNIQAVIPSTATQGSVSQGIWVEYSSTS